jgi:hypothetical protein
VETSNSGGSHPNTFEPQVDAAYSAMFWCCGDIASGPFARMLQSFFRLVTCSPLALVGALSFGALIAVASAERGHSDDKDSGDCLSRFSLQLEWLLRRRTIGLRLGPFELDRERARGAKYLGQFRPWTGD